MEQGNNLKPKPKQTLTCLETMCKISHSHDKQPSFHKSLKFMTIQKSTNDKPERNIPNNSEINPKILRKFMINPNIQK
jgi:hypothetical protein